MLHRAALLHLRSSKIYTYLYVGKRVIRVGVEDRAHVATRRPGRQHLPMPLISSNYLARRDDDSLMRDRPMNLCPQSLVFSRLLLLLVLILPGCAAREGNSQLGAAEAEDFNDPFEDTNRAIFDFNQVVDRNVLVPV